MPSGEDWQNCPLRIIQNLFDQTGSSDSALVEEYFSKRLQTRTAVSWVPSLNDTALHNLRPNSLVRFRCMIQDMFDPEFYLGLYEIENNSTGMTVLKSGKYKDIAECPPNHTIKLGSPRNVTMERLTLYCVPVPGENEWVKKTYADMNKSSSFPSTSKCQVRSKRGLEEEGQEDVEEDIESSGGKTVSSADVRSVGPTRSEPQVETKKQQQEKQGGIASSGPDLNYPLPGETGPPCLVKVYNGKETFKVNDLVEFIGVLSVDPSLAQFKTDGLDKREELAVDGFEVSQAELDAHVPPPSLVPRLHCVLAKRLTHVNPLLSPVNSEEYIAEFQAAQSEVALLRNQLLFVLEHALLGDSLAAEYFLCHLVSQVYARADVMPLGKFCLNLTNSLRSSAYSNLVHFLLSNFVTQSHLLPMSLENMNKLKFAPQKDYTSNRLTSGLLQLADRTELVIDETALQPGQLDTDGVRNIQALGNLISWQKVEYDFSFHKQDFPSNVGVLILSEGKSILPSDCQIPLSYSRVPDCFREYFAQLDPQLTQVFLTKVRTYIELARHVQYSVSEDIQKVIQDDFVDSRKEDPNSMTVDDFHSLLSLVRLLSVSHLKECPDLELWRRARAMERERKYRLSQLPNRGQT